MEQKLSALLVVLILAGGCGDPAVETAPAAARGGTAVIGLVSDPDSWNEYLAKQESSIRVLRRMYLPLARERRAENGSTLFEPRIAESWDVGPDGRTVTFRLRDIHWSDGTPLTAADVRFTWQAQVSGEVAWAGADSKSAIRDVTVDDAATVTFHLEDHYPDMMVDIIAGGILPRHVFGTVPFSEWRTHDWSEVRVGSGPFLLDAYRPGVEIRLVRNPEFYRRDRPFLDAVVFRIVPDTGNLVVQLKAGAVDLVEGLTPWQADSLAKTASVKINGYESLNYDYIGWNTTRPPLDDPEIRAALTMAIDRRGIVEELLYGYGVVSAGPVPSTYRLDIPGEPWPFDPDRAAEILSGKGFRLVDGMRTRNGVPLEFEMTTNAGNELRNMVMVRVQEQLGRIGVRVRLLPPMPMRAFVAKNMAGDFDAYVGGWTFTGKVELRVLFSSGAMPPDGFNVVGYRSGEVDEALEALDAAAGIPEMAAAMTRIQHRVSADQPYTFLFETSEIAAVSARIRDMAFDVPGDSLGLLEEAWSGS